MPTDSNTDASDEERTDASLSDSESRRILENERKRQSGINTALDKVKKENAILKDRADKLAADEEEEKSALRVQIAENNKAVKALQNERDLEKSKRETAETELAKLRAAKEADKLISDKYKNLLEDHLRGDLKIRSDFADNVAYEAYLDRLSKRFGGSGDQKTPDVDESKDKKEADRSTTLRQAATGATPAGGGRVTGSSDRDTAADIEDRMAKLNPRSPTYRKDYDELLAKYNEYSF